ncbi:MAG: CYTH domain-containing protein [Oscillospiraceae bacterium]|nr:CYTH domain-containing protein [Oscillospiraceae bacterium]
MELEYKWLIPRETLAALADFLRSSEARQSHEILHMAAEYYDTPDGLARRLGAALRLRRENGRTVCCMKRNVQKDGAQALREEYETEAAAIREGLQRLPDAGAPRDLCLLLAEQQLRVTAKTDFIRNCWLLAFDVPAPFTAEFAVDVGKLGNAERMQEFEELELEFKSGDAEAFRAFAEQLQTRFSLVPQPLSKLARAIRIC